jgi:ankyrin repeat protein
LTLHSACESSDLIGFKNLLAECTEVELEQKDDTGRTPLLVAAGAMAREEEEAYFDDEDDEDSNEHVIEPEESTELNKNTDNSSKGGEILQLLIQKGAKLDHKDEKGWTALHHACHAQSPVGITMLLKAGAIPMRDSYGLLPQDLLIRNQLTDTPTQADDLKASLDQLTEKSDYAIKLLAFRPSGIVQLDMGGQVEHRSFITSKFSILDDLCFEVNETLITSFE